jgi:acetyl esterase/lipase
MAVPRNAVGPCAPRGRTALTLLAAALIICFAAAGVARGSTGSSHRTEVSGATIVAAHKPPLLLLIPGGGFVERYDSMWFVARGLGRDEGYAVKELDYMLNNPLGAWKQIRGVARRARDNGREVYAYGESAGGNFAALLAQRGLATAASANAPPSDLTEWSFPGFPDYWAGMRNHSLRTRQFLSPAFHPSRSPILIQQSSTDAIVPASMNQRWAERDPNVRIREYAGFHVVGLDLNTYADNVRDALDYLGRQRARLGTP